MLPKQALHNLAKAGQPLIEVYVRLPEGFDAETILDTLNELGNDFEASLSIYCKMTGEKNSLCFDATPEALERIFGWQIKRVNFDGLYAWQEMNEPTKFPKCLEGKVIEIGLSQPGTNDNGKPYNL